MSCIVPVSVAKQSFLSQNSSLSETTIYTPSTEGDYIVETYVVLSAFSGMSGGASVGVVVGFTDPLGSQTAAGAQCGNSVGSGPVGSGFLNAIRAASGSNIQISTSFGSSDPSQTYNLYVTIIQI